MSYIGQSEPGLSGIVGSNSVSLGYLSVEGTPKNARVVLLRRDGLQAAAPCRLPCRFQHLVPGSYRVKIWAEGFETETYSTTVSLDPDQIQTLQVRLKRSGSLPGDGAD